MNCKWSRWLSFRKCFVGPAKPSSSVLCRNVKKDEFTIRTVTYLNLELWRNTWSRYVHFKVCKYVHHRTIQINHQPDATVFHFIILPFIYSLTCFGRFPAHHQELNDCCGSLWFYLRIVVIAVLFSWSGRTTGRPDHEQSTAITMIW